MRLRQLACQSVLRIGNLQAELRTVYCRPTCVVLCCAEPAALKSFILQKGVRGELDAVSCLWSSKSRQLSAWQQGMALYHSLCCQRQQVIQQSFLQQVAD